MYQFQKLKKPQLEYSAFQENVYRAIFPSPNTSYDIMKWAYSNETSNLSVSIEQDIDRALQIKLPNLITPLILENQHSEEKLQNSDAQDEYDLNNIGEATSQSNEKQLIESKITSNQSNQEEINKKQDELTQTQPQQNLFIFDIIQRYKLNPTECQEEIPESKCFLLHQSLISDGQAFKESTENQNSNIFDNQATSSLHEQTKRQCNAKQVESGSIDESAFQPNFNTSFNMVLQQTDQQSTCQPNKNVILRIEEYEKENQILQTQNKTKELSQAPSLISMIFNINQNWFKMKERKQAKKYKTYKSQLYQQFLSLIPGCYLHKSEGELKLDIPKQMDSQQGKFYQSFELLINPKILIGPLTIKKDVKLVHIRFKKGYSGEVFYDQRLSQTIPINQIDGITIINEPLILANNSDNPIKLVGCLIAYNIN